MGKAKVYFTREITPQAMVRMYEAVGVDLPGKVAVKLHSGGREPELPAAGLHEARGGAGEGHHRGVQHGL